MDKFRNFKKHRKVINLWRCSNSGFLCEQSAKAMMRYSPEESRLTLRQLLKNFRKNVSQSEEKLFEGKPV